MNTHAITYSPFTPFMQPLARNKIRIRLFAASKDLAQCTLLYWKRSEPYPQSLREAALHPRYCDGLKQEWITEVCFPEEAHYIKYFFRLTDSMGQTRYLCEHGLSPAEPQSGFFELLQIAPCDIAQPPQWARGIAYYQIFPERFAIGSPRKALHAYEPWTAAPTRDHFLGGDLKGIADRLEDLHKLGAECLYLTPVFAADFNHKYATTDYFRIDPDFGTTQELIAMVAKAHALGIRVLLDGVFNHVGIHFGPFEDLKRNGEASPYRDWFYPKRFPIEIDPACYECVGDYPYMPRLRTENPDVRQYLLSVLQYWIDNAGIDGWRLDVVDEVDQSTRRYLREELKRRHPEALLLGETWGDASCLVAGGDQMDCTMNYLFRDAMVDYFARESIGEAELDQRLQRMLMKYPDEVNLCMYNCLGSHDTPRFLTEAGGDRARLKLAVAFQILFLGSPALYYGDELGMEGENDPGCRGGMAWDQPDEELRSWTQALLALRRQNTAIRLGSYQTLRCDAGAGLFAFERRHGDERVLAFFNRSGHSIPIPADLTGKAETIEVSPRSVKIISFIGGIPCEPFKKS